MPKLLKSNNTSSSYSENVFLVRHSNLFIGLRFVTLHGCFAIMQRFSWFLLCEHTVIMQGVQWRRIVCVVRCRCGSRTGAPSGARRRRRGASRASWPSTGCTAPWCGTRYHCQIVSSAQRITASKSRSRRGYSVSIINLLAASLLD